MFKVCISDAAYQRLVSAEEQKGTAGRSNFYKLLKQQPVQLLTASDNERYRTHPEEVLKNPSALHILDMTHTEALAIQKTYGVMCMSSDCPDISPLIDVNDIHISNERERLGRGWDSVLDSVEKLPSNALLLTDRYLFAFRSPDAGDGLSNISSLMTDASPIAPNKP